MSLIRRSDDEEHPLYAVMPDGRTLRVPDVDEHDWRELTERNAALAEQLRGAVDLLREIAESDPVDNALDPDRNRRIAREYVASLTTTGGQ